MLNRSPDIKLPRLFIPVCLLALFGLFGGLLSANNQVMPLENESGSDIDSKIYSYDVMNPNRSIEAESSDDIICLDGNLKPAPTPRSQRDSMPELLQALREAANKQGWDTSESIYPKVPDAPPVRDELYQLGRLLAFDKVLSGNRDISCMTCHHPNLFAGDERMLGFGAGGRSTKEAIKRGRRAVESGYAPLPLALGTERTGNVDQIIPRHAPPLYNLHAYESLFWDGRIQYVANENNNGRYFLNEENIFQRVEAGQQYAETFDIDTPHGSLDDMEPAFEFGIVSTLSLFPMIDHKEMIGAATRAKNDRDDQTEDLIGAAGELLPGKIPANNQCAVVDQNGKQGLAVTNYNDLAAVYVANERLSADQRLSDEELRPVVWQAIIDRMECEAPAYLDKLQAAYPGEIQTWDDVKIEHISNAIGGYLIREFDSSDTPWNKFLDEVKLAEESNSTLQSSNILTRSQVEGAIQFFELGCARCHSGALFSDFEFHNTGLRQIGPGKGDGVENTVEEYRNGKLKATHTFTGDYGRERVTNDARDRFKFRTSTLINVGETWTRGHAGQFLALDDFIKHYQHPVESYTNYEYCFVNGPKSNAYGFTAEGGAGKVLEQMFWKDDLNNYDASTDAIISSISQEVLDLNDENGKFTDEGVVYISRFLRALTSETLCDMTDDNYYLYQQPATVEPIMRRVTPLDTDGSTWLDEEVDGLHKGDAPRVQNSDSYDLAHQVSQIPIDWFYREACIADADHEGVTP